MRRNIIYLFCLLFMGLTAVSTANINPNLHKQRKENNVQTNQDGSINLRMDCAQATQQIDQKINNVRARLLNGGDCWWDLDNGKYVVPAVDVASGQEEVSSIFAGAVWLGGVDPGGNLKLACQDYRGSNDNDFWPGPLTPNDGNVDAEVCSDWDRFWKVLGSNIDIHLKQWAEAKLAGDDEVDPGIIPEDIKGWPGRGNRFFFEINGFELPNTPQGLGAFFDQDEDGFYDPERGDYPIIEVRGCPLPNYPDEMIFWIYNDNGGIHTQTNGTPIRMEIQVQAFAYATSDEINDMTFQRYKLINRAPESIDSFYFAMWVDPDLGCHHDDYVGCDTARSLAYVYNMDAVDGDPGTQCNSFSGTVPTYGTEIPYLGIDYFRGPLGPKVRDTITGQLTNPKLGQPFDTIVELGMTSFTYYNNGGTYTGPAAHTDPAQPQEFYNYLTGSWRDGTPFTSGGNGYNLGSNDNIDFAFPDEPDDINGWSMCVENLQLGDRRTIQASGPLRLDPGAVNELIIGVVWVPNVTTYPCPRMDRLFAADEVAQNLFDNCFILPDGPDAPDVDWLELDKEIVGILTNDVNSNNFLEMYEEKDLRATAEAGADTLYKFQGYIVYQLSGPDVGVSELDDIEKSRVIFQSDINDGIATIYNWNPLENPNGPEILYEPIVEVEGADGGILHTFSIKEDQFSTADKNLINHKKYYFTAIAYGTNNWKPFNPLDGSGQIQPYFQGRKNVQTYTVIPRPMNDQILNAKYGDGVQITRLDGVGAGNTFLDVSDETKEAIIDGSFNGEVKYRAGTGPIDIQIFNPLQVIDGEYILTLDDGTLADAELGDSVHWVLTNTDTGEEIRSIATIDQFNEQLVTCFGFSVALAQTDDVGDNVDESNGVIGSDFEYKDQTGSFWFAFQPDADAAAVFNTGALNFIKTDELEVNFDKDPFQSLSTMSGGAFFPYALCDYNEPTAGFNPYITPAWVSNRSPIVASSNKLESLNNVDIVLTSDKSKWSRCVIIETATLFYTEPNYNVGLVTEGNRKQMDIKSLPSVGKEDSDGDGLPDPDGDGNGMGWFPGYAYDVETGKRLNIFFGENSVFSPLRPDFIGLTSEVGNDMMFNPNADYTATLPNVDAGTAFALFYLGGQHYVYVTDLEYDECAFIRSKLDPVQNPNDIQKAQALRRVKWTSMPFTQQGEELLSYADGLIPNELNIKIRVDNPYDIEIGTNEYNGYPSYRFELEGVESNTQPSTFQQDSLLDLVNVVPNPYYGFSSYEISQFTTTVKISNLPAKCTVTIYSLDGKFIRQYKRDEKGIDQNNRSNPGIKVTQVTPDLEWDLKNNKGIPIASGVYLIHIDAEGLGERVLKWFGVNRQFDPSGL